MFKLEFEWTRQRKWKTKNKLLEQFLKKYHFDIMGFQEINLNWSALPTKDQWEERVLGWWESNHVSVKAFNTQEEVQTATQPGGCMVVSANKAKQHFIECGIDPTGLGRWTWTRYRGRYDVTLRVVSAYRCNTTAGPSTVFSQQRRYFDSIGEDQ